MLRRCITIQNRLPSTDSPAEPEIRPCLHEGWSRREDELFEWVDRPSFSSLNCSMHLFRYTQPSMIPPCNSEMIE
jgi:hypothetical protein